MASGSAGEGAGSNTDKKTSKVVMFTPPVFATSLNLDYNNLGDEGKGAIRDAVSGRVGFELRM